MINKNYYLLLFSLALFISEILLISLSVDAQTIAQNQLSEILMHSGTALRWFLSTVFLLIILLYFKNNQLRESLPELASFSWRKLLTQVVLFLLFFYLTHMVFDTEEPASTAISLLWILFGIFVFLSWIFLTWHTGSLVSFINQNIPTLLTATIGGLIIILLTSLIADIWNYLSTIALYGSGFLLGIFHDEIILDLNNSYLGIDNFMVTIDPVCSGLEGLVISVTSTSVYMYLVKGELKFPRALILIPIAGLISILFNIIRIAVLISIGEYISPEIAIGGFHSVAGWISAFFVTFLMVFWFSSIAVLHKDKNTLTTSDINSSKDDDSQLAWAALVPFILFLFTSLILQIFQFDFDYLYGFKVMITGIALIYFWKDYLLSLPKKWLESIVTGVVVALLWFVFALPYPATDMLMSTTFNNMAMGLFILWMVLRIIGSWIIIPIIEEMIFRGYILARLSGQNFRTNGPVTFSWIALIGSSILFALIHDSVIAGFLAGVAFALLRLRTQSMTDVILAHSVANVVITYMAYHSGRWSLM